MTTDTLLLYEQPQLPTFQNRVYATAEEARACAKGDIRLIQNLKTGLVYNEAFNPKLMDYDGSYNNEQGISRHFLEHLEMVAGIVERTMGRENLVEVGCGKGLFLEMLLERGFDLTGFDPTYEGTNSRVKRHYFEAGVDVQGDGLILRHVLEHIQNPYEFLVELGKANKNIGRIYIEVPCFDWILAHRAWFDIFYEHVNYFRLPDFHRIFGNVIESGCIFGGQYLYVVAELNSVRPPVREETNSVDLPTDFTRTLGDQIEPGSRSAIWGGASKGVTFSLLKSRQGQPVDMVIDINPAKQGKYLPASGLLVQSPEQALAKLPHGSTIYVMNSNYLEEIRMLSNNAYTYVGIDHE
ncbi:class I SAM-dependent methyltransferase [Neorhizobium petrolearium]|uniref:class I SAM-dependent methyltransferase n=1 Tax=Neorhizobium petrolearium TaxID=515361 RepID=UPI003F7ECC06